MTHTKKQEYFTICCGMPSIWVVYRLILKSSDHRIKRIYWKSFSWRHTKKNKARNNFHPFSHLQHSRILQPTRRMSDNKHSAQDIWLINWVIDHGDISLRTRFATMWIDTSRNGFHQQYSHTVRHRIGDWMGATTRSCGWYKFVMLPIPVFS